MEVNSLLLIIKVTSLNINKREKKKWNIEFVMHRVKIYLMVQIYFTFTKDSKDYEMSFYSRNIFVSTWSWWCYNLFRYDDAIVNF